MLTRRGALAYYLLGLPAILLEAVFSIAIASNPSELILQTSPYAGLAILGVDLLPWVIVVASLVAIVKHRPSVLVVLLAISFFVAVTLERQLAPFGAVLNLGQAVALLITASFMAMIGFTRARGIKILGKRELILRSHGPLGYQVVAVALEVVLPLAAAVGLVLLVEAMVGALTTEAGLLPEPLSTLTGLYLQTRIGLVFTTLMVAGATIWAIRQFLEPAILYFTLSREDGRKELLLELQPDRKLVNKIASYRASKGTAWLALCVCYCTAVAVALAYFLPMAEVRDSLLSIFNLQRASPSKPELDFQTLFQGAVIRFDAMVEQAQDFARGISRVLWG